MATSLELRKYKEIKALLVCKSGLRIGGTEANISIGGAENPIIKDAKGMPYIPGSSLKGKLRSLLEYKYKRVKENGSPCDCGQPLQICPVCTIFGPHKNTKHELGPTRIIVRDAFLSANSLKDWEKARSEGVAFTETKTETSIDRRTGMAVPRTQERVNAGTEFQLIISVRIFEPDDEAKIVDIIKEAINMISKDTLGGSGTRGYGWVEIKNLEVFDC